MAAWHLRAASGAGKTAGYNQRDRSSSTMIREGAMAIERKIRNDAGFMNSALEAGEGILRLAPTWVPRSFLMPGRRLKLAPQDYYALGAHRGGIDERWFASTTAAANDNREPDEGLSYVVHEGASSSRFATPSPRTGPSSSAAGSGTSTSAGRSTASSSTTWARSRTTCTRTTSRPPRSASRASRSRTTFRRSSTRSATTSRTPSSAWSRARPRRTSAAAWSAGTRATTASSIYARRTACKPGTGWLVPPCILHAPGSLVTYEPQWGSDVFGMYQSMVEGRYVPWKLLVKDVPKEYHHDLDYLVEQLDWEANVNPSFKDTHYLEPIVADSGSGDGLRRPLDRLRQGRRRAAVHGQGADGQAGRQVHDQGQRRVWPDRRAGERADRQAAAAIAGDDPLRRADRGRGVRHRRRGPGGRGVRRTPGRSRS